MPPYAGFSTASQEDGDGTISVRATLRGTTKDGAGRQRAALWRFGGAPLFNGTLVRPGNGIMRTAGREATDPVAKGH